MSRVIKRPSARRDLVQIAQYLRVRNPRAAARFLAAFDRTVKDLAEMPSLGGRYESDAEDMVELRIWTIPGFREYIILYFPLPDGVDVIHVWHGSRDMDALLAGNG